MATHYVNSSMIPDILRSLRNASSLDSVNGILNAFQANTPPFLLETLMPSIYDCFKADCLSDIISRIKEKTKEEEPTASWALETLSLVSQNSPSAMTVTNGSFLVYF